MKLDSVGELMASRTLTIQGDGIATSEVTVLLGKPQRWRDQVDYFCPYQIKGAGDEKIRYTVGVDSFQAAGRTQSISKVRIRCRNCGRRKRS
jgi:hypothetical protein